MEETLATRRPRLVPYEQPSFVPFVKATGLEDCSVYWVGVSEFPMLAYQRDWLLEFLKRLGALFREEYELREEWFLQFKALYPDLLDTFVKRSSAYIPLTGMTLIPGTAPVPAPKYNDIKKVIDQNAKDGSPVDVNQWMPDHAQWFAMKNAIGQREDFFGHGGMFALYLAADPKTQQTLPKLPRFMTTHPAYTPELDRQYEMAMSVQDAFLAKSKQKFGHPFHDDASYEGLLFVLPLLSSTTLIEASAEQRANWFDVFDAYCIESKPDKGLLLACKDLRFDEQLIQLLEGMRDDKLWYRE